MLKWLARLKLTGKDILARLSIRPVGHCRGGMLGRCLVWQGFRLRRSQRQRLWSSLGAGFAIALILWPSVAISSAIPPGIAPLTSPVIPPLAQGLPALGERSPLDGFCRLNAAQVAEFDTLRAATLAGDANARDLYRQALTDRARRLDACRRRYWPHEQATWLRLYPCDTRPGEIAKIFDDLVNRGYNRVYLEVLYDGRILLPAANNPTVWPSVLRSPELANTDLLALAIEAGRARGIQVYAWLFTLNFGDSYAQRSDRQTVLARNGRGQSSLEAYAPTGEAFVDPYNAQARADLRQAVTAVLQRRPAGVLFDYVRYPRGTGAASVAAHVRDLWVYGSASRQALLNRVTDPADRAALSQYLDTGRTDDPRWWPFVLDHARQGVVDFLNAAIAPVQQQGIPAGAVFFPGGNQHVGSAGFDSRLQPWDRFPQSIEWHPMAYAICGQADCVVDEIQRVLDSSGSAQVIPAIAGIWQQPFNRRPALEAQMRLLRQRAPQVQALSHYSYEWQTLEASRDRKFCTVR